MLKRRYLSGQTFQSSKNSANKQEQSGLEAPKATIIGYVTEPIRRLFTDHHVEANVLIDGTTHDLQIMSYCGGVNKHFFLANCKIFSESPNAIALADKVGRFDLGGLVIDGNINSWKMGSDPPFFSIHFLFGSEDLFQLSRRPRSCLQD